eukprot:CAMPEP_0119337416 /NCGR_PEP_ID=MMETSP1333-20130426/93965_1 /TAXON_ID=418940 /ORGANISM="Scyphosphaera apsteinii, Strain RCC1455" /LENGTH=49 /DNA_ID= /DNA_START= /DNA_END= /DNA_ORIENTATION=
MLETAEPEYIRRSSGTNGGASSTMILSEGCSIRDSAVRLGGDYWRRDRR